MKTVLVTGGAGFIGSYLCEKLLRQGCRVIALDMADSRKIEHLLDHPDFTFTQGSVLDPIPVERMVKKADIVFHLAAIADPKRYVQEPLSVLNIDLLGALTVMDYVSQNSAKFVFFSTSEIYGKNPKVPWKEEDTRVLGPPQINRWCYSTAKAVVEHYCHAYHQQEGMSFVILRPFNVYGPKCDDLGQGRVIPNFLGNFLKDEPVYVHGDGHQTRCFTYVDDLVEGTIAAAFCKEAENQVFNIGSDRETSIVELAELIKQLGNFTSPIKLVPHSVLYGKSYEDVPRRVPDITKIKEVVGWQPTTPLEDGLMQTIDYYRSHY